MDRAVRFAALFALAVAGCSGPHIPEAKFIFKDRVEVMGGFYDGHQGVVQDRWLHNAGPHKRWRYQVKLDEDDRGQWYDEYFFEDELKTPD